MSGYNFSWTTVSWLLLCPKVLFHEMTGILYSTSSTVVVTLGSWTVYRPRSYYYCNGMLDPSLGVPLFCNDKYSSYYIERRQCTANWTVYHPGSYYCNGVLNPRLGVPLFCKDKYSSYYIGRRRGYFSWKLGYLS